MRVESVVLEGSPAMAGTARAAPTESSVAERGKDAKAEGIAPSSTEVTKHAYNRSILAASSEVALSSGNQALSLLYKSAIENLNQVLAPEFGDNAIQSAYDSGLDVSPQATADRIVSLSTAFFDKYRESNPDKDLETALKDFTAIIGGGIEKGFAEARQVLEGLKVLDGDIASNIDQTYDLVQAGLKAFVENYSRSDDAANTPAATEA